VFLWKDLSGGRGSVPPKLRGEKERATLKLVRRRGGGGKGKEGYPGRKKREFACGGVVAEKGRGSH